MKGRDLKERIPAGAGSEPRYWMRLTRACNNGCLFCLDGDQNASGEPLPFAALRKELRRGRSLGLRRVVLSGGEPTLHPRFTDVVREACRQGYTHVQAITNGRRFCYPRFLNDCVDAGLTEITFSMHGHTPELYEKLVGVPGAFPQALAGLTAALKVPGLIVSVDVVLNRLNVPKLEELLRFYVSLGVREFDLLHLVPFGRAWDNWKELHYEPEDFADSLRRGLLLSREGVKLWTNRLPARYLEGFEDLIQAPEKIHDEVRGRAGMFADFLRRGKSPGCRGRRCAHCFLRDFCGDLAALRKARKLDAHPLPPCLALRGEGETAPFLWRGARTDIREFTEFFIRHRYAVKGSPCRKCARRRRCAGAPIGLIRSAGFRILKPLAPRRKGETALRAPRA